MLSDFNFYVFYYTLSSGGLSPPSRARPGVKARGAPTLTLKMKAYYHTLLSHLMNFYFDVRGVRI